MQIVKAYGFIIHNCNIFMLRKYYSLQNSIELYIYILQNMICKIFLIKISCFFSF